MHTTPYVHRLRVRDCTRQEQWILLTAARLRISEFSACRTRVQIIKKPASVYWRQTRRFTRVGILRFFFFSKLSHLSFYAAHFYASRSHRHGTALNESTAMWRQNEWDNNTFAGRICTVLMTTTATWRWDRKAQSILLMSMLEVGTLFVVKIWKKK